MGGGVCDKGCNSYATPLASFRAFHKLQQKSQKIILFRLYAKMPPRRRGKRTPYDHTVAAPTQKVSTATNTEESAVMETEHVVLSSDEPESGNLFAASNCMPMVSQSNFTVPSETIRLVDDDIALQ